MTMIDLGTVRTIYRYPVRTMRGEILAAAHIRRARNLL